ncbi:LAQU0S03e01860g1_1 [Lachancea quebecensis]|uniref:LAQU0S03e01860g1_1 n=1 Tax=Lachancea quebecensis TaxID=1654605 RepID=A0A0P1KRA7_9SACH|nr:LAQU0S03e01860g1_1 [Lachancea quebecensis]
MKYTTQASIAGLVLTAFLLVRLLLGNYSAIRLAWPPLIVFKAYVPSFEKVPNVQYYDLRNYQGHADGWQRADRVLFTVPLRDAAEHLPMFFDHMDRISYPHNLIDLSFLVSDSSDDTMGVLLEYLQKAQSKPDRTQRFGNIEIYEKDFGQAIGQSFSDRHGFAAQGPRRKLMGRARNWLGSVALKPYHSWVYWRDVDVETIPPTILEDLMHHDRDVIVPNVWRPLPDWLGNIQPYDLNSWQESEGGLQLAESLDEDSVIVEGYPEYATWRTHLAYMRDPSGNPEDEMELDGIGGVSILSKAKVFRAGSHFPAFSFEKHAETEAFGKLSRRLGYSVVGLPHYVIWHIYEPSSDDLKHMAWMAEEEKRKIEENKIREFYDRVWQVAFDDVRDDWEMERLQVMKNIDPNVLDRRIVVDWDDDDAEEENKDVAGKAPDSSKESPKKPADKADDNSNAQQDTKDNAEDGKAAGGEKNQNNRPQGVEQLDFNPDS